MMKAEDAERPMAEVMEGLREKSPELDRRIRESGPRRELAMALVAIRRQAGRTQKEVAAAMGRDQAYVSRMESTLGPSPGQAAIDAYAHACNATAGYVFALGAGTADEQLMTVPLGNPAEAAALKKAIKHTAGH